MTEFATADLCDEHGDSIQVADPFLTSYGGVRSFRGRIATVEVFEDNSLVRQAIERPGDDRVLVVDGGSSMRCALVGDRIATEALANGWVGFVVNGCIRDSAAISRMPIGVMALATNPRKSIKRGVGTPDIAVRFAGVEFTPGAWLYADEDGVVVSEQDLIADDRRPTTDD